MKWFFAMIFVHVYKTISGFAYTCDDVQFVLYAGNKKTNTTTYLSAANASLAPLVNANVTAYSNGFRQAIGQEPGLTIIKAYLTAGDANVIHVKWERCSSLMYISSVACVPRIGRCVSDFLHALSTSKVIPSKEMQLVGFSLGAHVMGFAGQAHKQLHNSSFKQIIGLDPAGPLYQYTPKNNRLSEDDALSVVIIHTDAGYLGYKGNMGHVDFFCNSGSAPQPGCQIPDMFYTFTGCSHKRCGYYYAECIVSGNFIARKCSDSKSYRAGMCQTNDKQSMCRDISTNASGSYYLTTNSKPIYARKDTI